MTDTPIDAARRLARSQRLSRRRFTLLPLTGPGAAFSEVQGRQPGSASTAPEELAELISSIATVGVLQPILVEELDDGRRRLVAGERRLRAAKWLATSRPEEDRYRTIPAVVCPGPLPEEDRRVWQLVENLAREDLRPGELAAALLFERCSVLTAALLAAGVAVPEDVAALEDPVARFRALDRVRLRAGQSRLGAPWPDVLRRLGIQMTKRKAQQLVRAFAALPAEVSAEMDAAKIALHTRLRYLQLDRGNRAAATEVWQAVKQRGCPELLTAAVTARLNDETLNGDAAVTAAEQFHAETNAARQRSALERAAEAGPDSTGEGGDHGESRAASVSRAATTSEIPGELIKTILSGLKQLTAALSGGATLPTYDAGSLSLHVRQLQDVLTNQPPGQQCSPNATGEA